MIYELESVLMLCLISFISQDTVKVILDYTHFFAHEVFFHILYLFNDLSSKKKEKYSSNRYSINAFLKDLKSWKKLTNTQKDLFMHLFRAHAAVDAFNDNCLQLIQNYINAMSHRFLLLKFFQ